MAREQTTLRTRDGECRAWLVTPTSGTGPWPGVVYFMDAGGIRPAAFDMAQTVADAGYAVLLADLFYRFGPYETIVPKKLFESGDFMSVIGPLMATTGPDKAAEDAEAFIAYMDSRPEVAKGPFGAVGFCMGGGMAIAAAARFPDRFAAVGSFHGGNLATDKPNSPHLCAPKLKAELYIAAADNDHSYPPEMAATLEKALTDAGVSYRAETYAGCAHGWMKPDFPVYDEANAKRGWNELFALYQRKLKTR